MQGVKVILKVHVLFFTVILFVFIFGKKMKNVATEKHLYGIRSKQHYVLFLRDSTTHLMDTDMFSS